jgi:flavodoxin
MDGERTALILYGSETGSAQDVAEELGRLCERLQFATTICELNSVKIVRLTCCNSFSLAKL